MAAGSEDSYTLEELHAGCRSSAASPCQQTAGLLGAQHGRLLRSGPCSKHMRSVEHAQMEEKYGCWRMVLLWLFSALGGAVCMLAPLSAVLA